MMDTAEHQLLVATYDSHDKAESAIKALQGSGLDMSRLSIVGRDFHTEEHALGFYTSGDRMQFWGTSGAFWGGLYGLLVGSAFFVLPVMGPVVVMGPLVGWLVGALEGAAVGGTAGALAGAMASIGIPAKSIEKYEHDVKAGHFLVFVNGTADMLLHARAILGMTHIGQLETHGAGTSLHVPSMNRAQVLEP